VQAQAQDAFLRGLQRMNDFRSDTLRRALEDLREAVRLDPGSARAWATLSQCYLMLGARAPEVITKDDAYKEALRAATHALQLDDSVSEAHTELAEVKFYYEWNWEWAQREYQRALDLSPSNSHAMGRYSLFLSALGRHDEAFEMATAAARLDPLARTVRFTPAMALFYARRYDEAISAFLGLAEIPPFALDAADHYALGRSYLATGRRREAFEEIETALKKAGRRLAPWLAELARVHAADGNEAGARQILQELSARSDVSPEYLAFIHAALGNPNRAFEQLNRAADERSPSLLWANVDPRLDELRPDPRFRALIARIGLSQ
jgi:tetratricopeptide (TPR) repeat protein